MKLSNQPNSQDSFCQITLGTKINNQTARSKNTNKKALNSHANDSSIQSLTPARGRNNHNIQNIKFNGEASLNILPERLNTFHEAEKREASTSKSEQVTPMNCRCACHEIDSPDYVRRSCQHNSYRYPPFSTPHNREFRTQYLKTSESISERLNKEKLINEENIDEFIRKSKSNINKSFSANNNYEQSQTKLNSSLRDEKLLKSAKKLIHQLKLFTDIKSSNAKKNWTAQTKKINLFSLTKSNRKLNESIDLSEDSNDHKEISLQCTLSKSDSQQIDPVPSRNENCQSNFLSFSVNNNTEANISLQEMYQKKIGTNKESKAKSTIKNKTPKTLKELIGIRKQIIKEKVKPKIINYSIKITPKKPSNSKANGSVERLVKGEKMRIDIKELITKSIKDYKQSKLNAQTKNNQAKMELHKRLEAAQTFDKVYSLQVPKTKKY